MLGKQYWEDWPETAKAVAPLISLGFAEIAFFHVIQWLTADFSLDTKKKKKSNKSLYSSIFPVILFFKFIT